MVSVISGTPSVHAARAGGEHGGEELIVAAGGMSLIPMFDPMASVEVYSPLADKWTLYEQGTLGALPHPIGFGSGAAINSTHMLACGGYGPNVTGVEVLVFSLP